MGVDLLGIGASAGLVGVSGMGFGAGVALDATGIGALAGVPLDVVSPAGIAAGVAGAGYFGHDLAKDLMTSESRSLDSIKSDPGYGATPVDPGDQVPVSSDGTPGNPFNSEVAGRVPAWGLNGAKTEGIVEFGDGNTVGIASGQSEINAVLKDVPEGGLQDTGLNYRLQAHVEAQTPSTCVSTASTTPLSTSTGSSAGTPNRAACNSSSATWRRGRL
jgi:hypothetical protein